jgi:hypothetical protein
MMVIPDTEYVRNLELSQEQCSVQKSMKSNMSASMEKQIFLVAAIVATIGLGITAMVGTNQVFAACTGDPNDGDAPTANPHDPGEHGNPHDSHGGGHHGEGDNCNGAQ